MDHENSREPISWQDDIQPPINTQRQVLITEIISALYELADGKKPISILGMLALEKNPLTVAQLSACSETLIRTNDARLEALVCAGLIYSNGKCGYMMHSVLTSQ